MNSDFFEVHYLNGVGVDGQAGPCMGLCMGGAWHGAWVGILPGLVMLDLGVGEGLDGDGEEVFGVVSSTHASCHVPPMHSPMHGSACPSTPTPF